MKINSTILQLLKFFTCFCLSWFMVVVILVFLGFTGMSETSYQETTVVNGEVSTYSSTISEETLREDLAWVATLGGLVIASFALLITDFNTVNKLKMHIPQMYNDLEADIEKKTGMLSQATRVVDKYMKHEFDTFSATTNSRSNVLAVPHKITTAKEFKATFEAYPTLKTNEAVTTLLHQIEKCETDIALQKKLLNEAIFKHNSRIHTFPIVFIRHLFNFEDFRFQNTDEKNQLITDEELGI